MRTSETFFVDRHERNRRCKQKDAIICPILDALPIRDPEKFKAILMPCLHAPELHILGNKGVPSKNLLGVEREREIWKRMKLRGINVGHAPMDVNEAMDYAVAENPEGYDLIYPDNFSYPGFNHMVMFKKIFGLGMLKPGGKLVVTFGKGRSRHDVKELNDMLLRKTPEKAVSARVIIESAIELTKHRRPSWIKEYPYESLMAKDVLINYLTTEVQF